MGILSPKCGKPEVPHCLMSFPWEKSLGNFLDVSVHLPPFKGFRFLRNLSKIAVGFSWEIVSRNIFEDISKSIVTQIYPYNCKEKVAIHESSLFPASFTWSPSIKWSAKCQPHWHSGKNCVCLSDIWYLRFGGGVGVANKNSRIILPVSFGPIQMVQKFQGRLCFVLTRCESPEGRKQRWEKCWWT